MLSHKAPIDGVVIGLLLVSVSARGVVPLMPWIMVVQHDMRRLMRHDPEQFRPAPRPNRLGKIDGGRVCFVPRVTRDRTNREEIRKGCCIEGIRKGCCINPYLTNKPGLGRQKTREIFFRDGHQDATKGLIQPLLGLAPDLQPWPLRVVLLPGVNPLKA